MAKRKIGSVNSLFNQANSFNDDTQAINLIAQQLNLSSDSAKQLYLTLGKVVTTTNSLEQSMRKAAQQMMSVKQGGNAWQKHNQELEKAIQLYNRFIGAEEKLKEIRDSDAKERAKEDKRNQLNSSRMDSFRNGNIKQVFKDMINPNNKFNSYISNNRETISANLTTLRANQDRIKELQNKMAYGLLNPSEIAEAKNEVAGLRSSNTNLETENKSLNTKNAKAAAAQAAMNLLIGAAKKVTKLVNETFTSITGLSYSIKGNFESILSGVTNWTNMKSGMATYSTGTSLITNSSARTMQMQYGLSSGSTFAMSNAMSTLGISSNEDLMYMNSNQRQLFTSLMTKYTAFYDEMESSGVLQSIQETQVDLELFKQEMQVKLLQWVSEHKDELISAAKGMMKIVSVIVELLLPLIEGIANAVSWIGSKVTGGSSASSASSLMSDYYSNTSSISSSISITNNNQVSGFGIEGVAETLGNTLGNQYKEAYLALGGDN